MNRLDAYKFGLGWKDPSPQTQPRPPKHWPHDCQEVLSHEWLRVFRCSKCGQTHTYMRDEILPDDAVACDGSSAHVLHAEPSR